jgi:hypothetical protein
MWQLLLLTGLAGAAPAPVADDSKPPLVTPKRLIEMFQTNEAFADERYAGKVIHVRGKVVRIRAMRNTRSDAADVPYSLELDAEGAGGDRDDRLVLGIFFDKKDRKALAALNPGDVVTVVGRCSQRYVWPGDQTNGGKEYSMVQIDSPTLVPKKEGAGRQP